MSVDESIKYQVLTKETAFIGVVEQENDDDFEELEPIRFGQGVIRTPEPEFPIFEEDFFFDVKGCRKQWGELFSKFFCQNTKNRCDDFLFSV